MRKHNLAKIKLEKQINKLSKDNQNKIQQVLDREKEIQGQQLKLREFMQKNIQHLQPGLFDQIEDIITQTEPEGLKKARRGSMPPPQIKQTRQMAETYKTIQKNRDFEQRAQQSLLEMIQERSYMDKKQKTISYQQERYKSAVRQRAKPMSDLHNDYTHLYTPNRKELNMKKAYQDILDKHKKFNRVTSAQVRPNVAPADEDRSQTTDNEENYNKLANSIKNNYNIDIQPKNFQRLRDEQKSSISQPKDIQSQRSQPYSQKMNKDARSNKTSHFSPKTQKSVKLPAQIKEMKRQPEPSISNSPLPKSINKYANDKENEKVDTFSEYYEREITESSIDLDGTKTLKPEKIKNIERELKRSIAAASPDHEPDEIDSPLANRDN